MALSDFLSVFSAEVSVENPLNQAMTGRTLCLICSCHDTLSAVFEALLQALRVSNKALKYRFFLLAITTILPIVNITIIQNINTV
ncbi:hypothetical protein CRENPOLYSF2_530006 [Crenothrix polyspora]|uniref:Uncharacterized protein n=1 Tax=Crenothrix polyspora TaxID=360316 RepID=A0A1R4HGI0_9GAMM|nr:hypothetical protein CRENPOLYSF2_530006 [Crenothrix polyspora]